ncbi:MAG: methyltransferase domain-containing protein [Deltaproteobacteria bacterium]
MSKLLPGKINGPVIELGSGGGFLEEYISDLITSEILAIPTVDIQFEGRFLPFKHASVRALVMLDVFHHIPDPAAFLAQAADILKPGGRLIMIEPWVTPWSRFVYRYLHHEPFDHVLSGGLIFKNMLPAALYPLCRRVENLLRPFNHLLSMFATIVLWRK